MDAGTNIPSSPDHPPVQLTKAQKRDLLGMSAAAVITTAMIAAPVVAPLVGGLPTLRPPMILASAPVETSAVSVVIPEPVFMAASAPLVPKAPVVRARPAPAAAAIQVVAAVRAAEAPILTASRKRFGRLLAGLLVGDGTHAVRPFPTVPERH